MKVTTIKDVANQAKVSVATVSRVLNQSKPVSAKIQEKVLKAVEELNFKPNHVARSLVMKQSLLIGVIIPEISNMFFSVVVQGVEEECHKNGYTPLLCNTNGEVERELQYLNILKDKYIDGIIILSTSLKKEFIDFFEENDIPVVFTSLSDNHGGKFDCVTIDDFQASYDATEYLIQLGHRKIGILSGWLSEVDSGYSRYSGYRKALEDYNIQFDEKWFFEKGYDAESGYSNGEKMFSMADRPTAIFCVCDAVAMGAIHAASEMGIRVPEDLSIIGFDDIPIAKTFRPGLTTIRQPIFDIGAEAAKLLLDQVQNKDKKEGRKQLKILPHKIVVRESCRKLD